MITDQNYASGGDSTTQPTLNPPSSLGSPAVSGAIDLHLISEYGKDSPGMIVYRALLHYKREQVEWLVDNARNGQFEDVLIGLDEIESITQIQLDITAMFERAAADNKQLCNELADQAAFVERQREKQKRWQSRIDKLTSSGL